MLFSLEWPDINFKKLFKRKKLSLMNKYAVPFYKILTTFLLEVAQMKKRIIKIILIRINQNTRLNPNYMIIKKEIKKTSKKLRNN